MSTPDFHRVTWYDRLRLHWWAWQAFNVQNDGERQARLEAVWNAWTSRFHRAPPHGRLMVWHMHRGGG